MRLKDTFSAKDANTPSLNGFKNFFLKNEMDN